MHTTITSPAFFIGKGDGTNLISFGSGQPDIAPPQVTLDAQRSFTGFRYGLVQGDLDLRIKLATQYPHADAEQFVVTNGASEAIDLVLRALAEPRALVALPRPYYYSYPHNVRLAGMEPVYYDLVDGKIDMEEFTRVARECRAVIINSPSNPTGTVQEVATLTEIEKFCEKHSIWVISDEVYKDLMYVRENYLIQGARVVTVNSFSKTFAMCNHRVGYLWARDRALVEKVVEMKSHTAMNTSGIGQAMALAALDTYTERVAETLPVWRARRDIMYRGMKEMGLEVWEPEGAFYILPKIKDPTRAMHDLFYIYNIITYDGTWFGAPDRLRFSFALDIEKIEEGLRRLKMFLNTEYLEY
jgi:aspartate aminotransferase